MLFSCWNLNYQSLPLVLLLFSKQNAKLLENFHSIGNTFLSHYDHDLVNILLYVSSKYGFSTNNKTLSLAGEFLESMKRFDKELFSIISTFHEHMTSFQHPKDTMYCRQHHVDTMLTLGRRCVFSWLQFIANCYNFILKNNIKFAEKDFLCSIFVKAFDFMNLLGLLLS